MQVSEETLMRLADEVELVIERAVGHAVDVEIDPVRGVLSVQIGKAGPRLTLSPGPGLMRRVMGFARSFGSRIWRWLF